MTTYDQGSTSPAGDEGPEDRTQRAAEAAREEGKHVGQTAKGEAENVAAETQQQAKNLLDDARSQVEQQSKSQLDNLVSLLQGFGDDLERMTRGQGASAGLAQDVVTQISDKAKAFGSQIQGREPSEVLDQVRGFARRKPGTFLLGALAAGVVAGRVTRGAKDAHSDSARTSTTPPATPPTTMGAAGNDPLAGTDSPHENPVYPEGTATSETAWNTPASGAPTGGSPPGPVVDPTRGTP